MKARDPSSTTRCATVFPCLALAAFAAVSISLKAGEIVLTASEVNGARDIEMAMDAATSFGTQPGVVTLDASAGDFFYLNIDRSINIYLSDITLRSLNGARLVNCGDGVFFDGMDLHNVVIEGITFYSEGSGLSAWSDSGGHRNVTVRGNRFLGGLFGVSTHGASNWSIRDNEIEGWAAGALITNCRGLDIHKNIIRGEDGLVLFDRARDNRIVNNDIDAFWSGVFLGFWVEDCQVIANRIRGVASAGVVLDWETYGNKVHGNRVLCCEVCDCLAVWAWSPDAYKDNKITGNHVK